MARQLCLILAIAWTTSASAQNYPHRAIRLIVSLAPARAGDIIARTVSAKLAEMWGQQIIIDNRPGANTIIGTGLVAKARPDGYTWLLGVQGSLVINQVLAMPDVRHKLVDEGANELEGSTPEALGRLIRTDIQKYRKLYADAGIRIE